MSFKTIGNIFCSLNAGLIYNVNYSFQNNGSTIILYFVNKSGQYTHPAHMQKVTVGIGSAFFSMYVVASSIQLSSGRRILEVTLVDESFKLDNYYIALTGRGCGKNVFQLGTPVDDRTPEQKIKDAIDPDAQKIKNFTEFSDLEYSFNDFLNVVRRVLNVNGGGGDDLIKRDFTGSFRSVLSEWCELLNLSFYFENGTLVIFDPTNLTISFPTQPADAIEYTDSIDSRDTYGQTVCNWFQQEGGEFNINEAALPGSNDQNSPGNEGGPVYVRTHTLFPAGYEFNLEQSTLDLNQVAAAQFGQEFWFLYNYYLGTTETNCGWYPVTDENPDINVIQSVQKLNGKIAVLNTEEFNERYQAFLQYGTRVAGNWYLSNELDDFSVDQGYQWFEEATGPIFSSFAESSDKSIALNFYAPDKGLRKGVINETVINKYFPGINFFGKRIIYLDNRAIDFENFVLSEDIKNLISLIYKQVIFFQGSASMDFSELGQKNFVGYLPEFSFPNEILQIFNNISKLSENFKPRYTSFPIKGISFYDYQNQKAASEENTEVDIIQKEEIVRRSEGPSIISNSSVIKTVKDGAYKVYFAKYSDCVSFSTNGNYFQHRFNPRQISQDINIPITYKKLGNNTYNLNRDTSYLNKLVNNPYLSQIAQARSFPTRRVSFSVNYFYSVPANFLRNGLVSLSVNITENGVNASYTFSNEVLKVPRGDKNFYDYEQQIRNSYIRKYQPKQTIY